MAAGFDLGQFWRLTPRSYALMMRGARDGDRARRLSMAEAVRAGTRLDADDFERWVAAVSGHDSRLPPEALNGVLTASSAHLERITWDEALKRMN